MTQEKTDSLKEFFRKGEFQGHILEVLVYFASSMGKNRLPTIQEFILSEVVAATIEYLTGKEYIFTYHRMENGKEYITVADGWEWKTNEALSKALKQCGDKLNPPFREAIAELTKLTIHHDQTGGRGYDSWLYTYYKLSICQSWMVSTFSFSVEFINKVKKDIIPSLEPETLKHCKAIARIMKKYVKQDIELIKRRYHW